MDQYFTSQGIYEKYEVKKIDVSGPYNLDYLYQFFDAFQVKPEKRGWPAIFFGSDVIVGDQPIMDSFAREIERANALDFPTVDAIKNSGFGEDLFSRKNQGIISTTVLAGAALVDAINPCAFAVLVLLVSMVIAVKGREEGLFAGILFSVAVGIAYFIMGILAYWVFGTVSLPRSLPVIMGAIAVGLGCMHLKDSWHQGKLITTEVPFRWRSGLRRVIEKIRSPWGAFGAGFVVSVFLLPCVSGPYIVVIGLLAEEKRFAYVAMILAFYNLIFITPMLVISCMMYFGTKARRLNEFKVKTARLFHVIASAIMLFIGVYLIVSHWERGLF